jgi:DNA invertase Pin-like site-specific DNA recombinase
MRNLVLLVNELRQRGIHFKSLKDSIDTSSPMGRFLRCCRVGFVQEISGGWKLTVYMQASH